MSRLWFVSIALLLFVAIHEQSKAGFPLSLEIYGLSAESVIAIVIAVVFGLIAIRFERHNRKFLKSLSTSQVYEKTAMMYGYASELHEWKVKGKDYVENVSKRIQSDISALQSFTELIRKNTDQVKELNKAIGRLTESMKGDYPLESVEIKAVFDSLRL